MAEDQKDKDSTDGKPVSISPIVLVFLILNSIGLAALGFFQYTYIKKQAAKPSVEDIIKKQLEESQHHPGDDELIEAKKDEGRSYPLDTFSVNLAQGDGPRRYLRLNTVLKFTKDARQEELDARKPQIRDSIISILNAKRPEDLLKKEGKIFLKDEIKAAINAYLTNGKLEDVFYTGFQVN